MTKNSKIDRNEYVNCNHGNTISFVNNAEHKYLECNQDDIMAFSKLGRNRIY